MNPAGLRGPKRYRPPQGYRVIDISHPYRRLMSKLIVIGLQLTDSTQVQSGLRDKYFILGFVLRTPYIIPNNPLSSLVAECLDCWLTARIHTEIVGMSRRLQLIRLQLGYHLSMCVCVCVCIGLASRRFDHLPQAEYFLIRRHISPALSVCAVPHGSS